MQQLVPPYEFYRPSQADDGTEHNGTEHTSDVAGRALLQLLAPVTGPSYHLKDSPYAVDQLCLHGAGGWQRPRTQKVLAPARCKLLKLSPCRSYWTFALNKSLRMHMQIKAQSDLPLAHALIEPGTLLQAGQSFATISANALKQRPMVVLTLQQVKSTTPLAVSWQTGQLSAGEDGILAVHAIPAYQVTPG